MAALCRRHGHYIFVLWFLLSFSTIYLLLLSFFHAYSQLSQIGCLPYFQTWCGLSANLGCRSETCCTRLTEIQERKKLSKIRHLCTIAQLCRGISSQLRHVLTIRKNLLNSNFSPTCPYNMVNFGSLAAEIVSFVWGTPANFNGFRVLAALLRSTLVAGVSRTLQCWTEGAIYIWQGGHHVGHCPHYFVLLYSSSEWWKCAFVVLGFVFSIPSQGTGLGNISEMNYFVSSGT